MCLNITVKDTKNKNKAIELAKKQCKSTITVYKVLKYDLTSPHKDYQYELGYHYYNIGRYKFTFDGYSFLGINEYKLKINQGLHAYTSLKKAKYHTYKREDRIVIKCIIPKGSYYFIDRLSNEIVTDNLILKSIIS